MLSVTSGYRSMPEDAFASPALFLLLANKADLTAAVDSRKGAKLADSYGAEFAGIMPPYQEKNLRPFDHSQFLNLSEVSAATGWNVEETLVQLTTNLCSKLRLELAQSNLESIVDLQQGTQSKKVTKQCCLH